MRELKFRAWDTQSHRMDTTFVISSQGCVSFTPLGMQQRDLDHYVIMQYTGVKDTRECEIYEGDIIGNEYGDILGTVEWSDGRLQWVMGSQNTRHVWYTPTPLKTHDLVVGNIYENPELLGDNHGKT